MIFRTTILLFVLQVNALNKEIQSDNIVDNYAIILTISCYIFKVAICCLIGYLIYNISSDLYILWKQELGTNNRYHKRDKLGSGSHTRSFQNRNIDKEPKQTKKYKDMARESELANDIYSAALRYETAAISYKADGDVNNSIEMFGKAALAHEQIANKMQTDGIHGVAGYHYSQAAYAYKESRNKLKAIEMLNNAAQEYTKDGDDESARQMESKADLLQKSCNDDDLCELLE